MILLVIKLVKFFNVIMNLPNFEKFKYLKTDIKNYKNVRII